MGFFKGELLLVNATNSAEDVVALFAVLPFVFYVGYTLWCFHFLVFQIRSPGPWIVFFSISILTPKRQIAQLLKEQKS